MQIGAKKTKSTAFDSYIFRWKTKKQDFMQKSFRSMLMMFLFSGFAFNKIWAAAFSLFLNFFFVRMLSFNFNKKVLCPIFFQSKSFLFSTQQDLGGFVFLSFCLFSLFRFFKFCVCLNFSSLLFTELSLSCCRSNRFLHLTTWKRVKEYEWMDVHVINASVFYELIP